MNMYDPEKVKKENKEVKEDSIKEETLDLQEVMTKEDPIDLDPRYNYIDVLPSKYKLYPDGTKLYARPLTTIEVKSLSTMNEKNANLVINNVLRECIKGLPSEQILLSDKLYLIFWLRANTYKSSDYKIKFACGECGTEGEYTVLLETLDVKDIKDGFSESDEKKLPESGETFSIRALRIKDEDEVKSFLLKNQDIAIRYDKEMLEIANHINTIGGVKKGLMAKYRFLTELSPFDYSYIESYLEYCDMGVNPRTQVECEKCGGMANVSLTFRPEFFLPKHTF